MKTPGERGVCVCVCVRARVCVCVCVEAEQKWMKNCKLFSSNYVCTNITLNLYCSD
jgi:hypothetical protein